VVTMSQLLPGGGITQRFPGSGLGQHEVSTRIVAGWTKGIQSPARRSLRVSKPQVLFWSPTQG
jgi:hypothetical protein